MGNSRGRGRGIGLYVRVAEACQNVVDVVESLGSNFPTKLANLH